MPPPTPIQVRISIVRAIDAGIPYEQVAVLFDVSLATVYRMAGKFYNGEILAPEENNGGRIPLTNFQDRQFLINLLHDRPSLYLRELSRRLWINRGINITPATVGNTLRRMNYTRKVIDRRAMEIDPIKVQIFLNSIAELDVTDNVYWLDECHFNLRSGNRRYGYATRGDRAVQAQPFQRGIKYSVVGAIGFQHRMAAAIYVNAINAIRLEEFLDNELIPHIEEGSTLIMDNVAFHRSPMIRELIEDNNLHVIFLPPYCPQYNPIEYVFNKLKAYCKANFNRYLIDQVDIIRRAWGSISPQDCRSFVKNCDIYNYLE